MFSESPGIALRKRAASIIAAFAMVTLVVAKLIAHYSPATAFKVASGLVSHQICSSTFVSHQNPDEAFGRISPTLGPLSWVATYDIDYQQSVVSARIRIASLNGTMSFLSTTTVFGTANDITLAELALEMLFPEDQETIAIVNSLDGHRSQRAPLKDA